MHRSYLAAPLACLRGAASFLHLENLANRVNLVNHPICQILQAQTNLVNSKNLVATIPLVLALANSATKNIPKSLQLCKQAKHYQVFHPGYQVLVTSRRQEEPQPRCFYQVYQVYLHDIAVFPNAIDLPSLSPHITKFCSLPIRQKTP